MIIQLNQENLKNNKFNNDEFKNFKTGEVEFKIEEQELKHSDKIGGYIKLKLKIENDIKQSINISSIISFKDFLWKAKQFAESIGKSGIFDGNSIDLSSLEFVGLKGKAMSCKNDNGYVEIKKWLPRERVIQRDLQSKFVNQPKPEKDEFGEIPF